MLEFIGSIIKPVTNLIDDLNTSDEERLTLKKQMTAIENELTAKVLDYEARLLESRTKVITAEAQGDSWLQRNWRPITMLVFLGLVVTDTFGLTTFRLAPDAWTLLQLGISGYVVGRSAEKSMPHISQFIKNKR